MGGVLFWSSATQDDSGCFLPSCYLDVAPDEAFLRHYHRSDAVDGSSSGPLEVWKDVQEGNVVPGEPP